MMANFLPDSIDFSAYMAATDADHKVVPAKSYTEDVIEYFHGMDEPAGQAMPWKKTRDTVRFRAGEVTLWAGFNGHGKSLLLGQCCNSLIAQQQRICIASLEMKPAITLARMNRQAAGCAKPAVEAIRDFHGITDRYLWLYDQQGVVNAERMLAVMRYCAKKLQIQHFVIDSLMKCGMAEDDYTAQKLFIDQLCSIGRDTGMHVHLVAHSKKAKDEFTTPGKMDVKGSGSITDQVDNVMTVWRNKKKEHDQSQSGGYMPNEPDTVIVCDKQRNGEWEGKIGLWFDQVSMQFLESAHESASPMRF